MITIMNFELEHKSSILQLFAFLLPLFRRGLGGGYYFYIYLFKTCIIYEEDVIWSIAPFVNFYVNRL